jgi:regulator of protease activity HflC (stomatin/prohibitin superfamily)
VDVGLTARFNFTLNTNPDSISAFDTAFGIRDFAGADGERRSPWDGDVGMETFLDQMVKPIIESSLRQQIGNVRCADLYASCALVQNGGGGTPQAQVNQQNGAVIQQIQDKIDAAFVANVNSQLGGNFFTAVRVSIVGVDLPAPIRTQITSAQAAFAAVSESQARAQQASADADANANRQRGYLACPTCAQLDEIRAQGDALAKIPSSVSVYAPGSGAGVVVQAGK